MKKDSEELKLFEDFLRKIETLIYFKPSLSLEIKGNKINFFKINVVKLEDFSKSEEYSIIAQFFLPPKPKKNNYNISLRGSNEINDDKLNIDEINHNYNDEKAKNKKRINAYYCGILKSEIEEKIKEMFGCILIKYGHTNQLSIEGLDYIFFNIEKSYFSLPGQKIHNLVKVGKLDQVTEITYTDIDNQLYPFIMANILEGTSIYKVEDKLNHIRLGGSGLGASSYWSLVSMICGYDDPEKAVEDAIKGNNELIDLSVSDIYGGGYDTFNLDSSLIASSFGKLKHISDMSQINKQDISRSLMTLMCVTTSQICGIMAKQENIKNVIIVGNSFDNFEFMQMVQMCIDYYSQGASKAYFTQYSAFINLIGMINTI